MDVHASLVFEDPPVQVPISILLPYGTYVLLPIYLVPHNYSPVRVIFVCADFLPFCLQK